MSIVFNEGGLKDAAAPCIAQTFVNHNAQLFKVYVLGDQQFVVQRPSIKNIYAGSEWPIVSFRNYLTILLFNECYTVTLVTVLYHASHLYL